MYKPYGYIPESIKPGSAVYDLIFNVGAGEVRESFNWIKFLPARERQYWIPFCVSFSRLNCAEAVGKKQGIDINFSDRELGVISGTTITGNSMEPVSEFFRKVGVRKEQDCPFTEEMVKYGGDVIWKKIFDLPNNTGQKVYKGGNHSWVYGRAAMVDALDHSPLQIAVGIDGNWEKEGMVQTPSKIEAYHAVTLYYIDALGYMYIQDSIGREFKKLNPDYPLTGVKSFRDLPENWKDIMVNRFFIKQGDKIGVLVTEGFTFGGGFAKDMNALENLKQAFEFKGDEPTINLPVTNA